MDVSSTFSAPGFSKCIIGVSYNILHSTDPSFTSSMLITESSPTITYTMTFSNAKSLFTIFCQARCQINSYPDYNISTTACSTCPIIPNCTICLDYSKCGSCNNNTQFLNDNYECVFCSDYIFNCSICSSKYNCDFCDTGFYSNEVANYTCSPCINLDPNCLTCNGSRYYSACLSC